MVTTAHASGTAAQVEAAATGVALDDHSDQVLAEVVVFFSTGLLEVVDHSDQVLAVVVALYGLVEVVVDHSDQVLAVVVVFLYSGVLEVVAQVLHAAEVVVEVTSGTAAHGSLLAMADAEAAPTMAAVAMKDFILIFGLGSRKSDCGQRVLLARKSD